MPRSLEPNGEAVGFSANGRDYYTISDAPRVGGGRIYLGNAGSESGKKNRGYVSAYDPYTGRMLWRFYTVPSDDPAQNTTPAMQMAAKSWTGDAWKPWSHITYSQ